MPTDFPNLTAADVEALGLKEWLRYRLGPKDQWPSYRELAAESGLSPQLMEQLLSDDPKYALVGFKTRATHYGLAAIRQLRARDAWEPVEHIGRSHGYPVPARCDPTHRMLDGLTTAELAVVAGTVRAVKATRTSPFLVPKSSNG